MIRQYKKGDALLICPQAAQVQEQAFACFFDELFKAYSAVDDKGRVAVVFGFDVEEGKLCCYSLFDRAARCVLLEVVRFMKTNIGREMEENGAVRAEMTVKRNFGAGERLAKMLGFKAGEVLENFYQQQDYQLFYKEKTEWWHK